MRSSSTPASVAVVRPATATTPPTMAETMAATMTMRRQTCPGSCAVAGVGSMPALVDVGCWPWVVAILRGISVRERTPSL